MTFNRKTIVQIAFLASWVSVTLIDKGENPEDSWDVIDVTTGYFTNSRYSC